MRYWDILIDSLRLSQFLSSDLIYQESFTGKIDSNDTENSTIT